MGEVMPLHAILGEKVIKVFSFIFSVAFDIFTENYNKRKYDI